MSLGSSLHVPCVQELAKKRLKTVPSRYIRFAQEPPITQDASFAYEVPVISLQNMLSGHNSELQKLHSACKEGGILSGKTILNEVEGLQIKMDGMWVSVKPHPNAFIVNVGDSLEIVTNGLYRSIEHRATVNKDKERLSIAMFHSANVNGHLCPAPNLVTPETPAQFRKISVPDFYKGIFFS